MFVFAAPSTTPQSCLCLGWYSPRRICPSDNNFWSGAVRTKRPRLRHRDRVFWVALSHLWRAWRSILVIVKPETVIKWHRQGFNCYWRWRSRAIGVGGPRIDPAIRDLIRRMSLENPSWGVPRIQAELNLLGYEVAESTVAKDRVRSHKPPSQTWKSFLRNHAGQIAAIDFFTVPPGVSMCCTASSCCSMTGGRWPISM